MSISISRLLFSTCFSLFVLWASTVSWAQKDTGTIVGVVHDPSGAVVSGAKITVADVERGQNFTTTTNESG